MKLPFGWQLPQREQIFASRWLKPLAPLFDHPCFWTLNRRRAALSVAIGLFSGLMPGPTQMATALLIAWRLRSNLPLAMFTTLYSNPLTYLPLYYVGYQIGSLLLTGSLVTHMPPLPEWGDSQYWIKITKWIGLHGKPLLVGVPLLGLSLALIGYFTVSQLWRLRSRRKRRQGRVQTAP